MAEIIVKGQRITIDDEDVSRVSERKWTISPQGYATTTTPRVNGYRKTIGLHRFLLNDPECEAIDHINRNKLDNRKCNLRQVTHSENCRNKGKRRGCSSQHRGVSWNRRKGKWQVVIRDQGRLKWLGWFESEDEAAIVAAPHFAGIAP